MARSFYGKTGYDLSNTLLDDQTVADISARFRRKLANGAYEAADYIRGIAYTLANVSPREVGHARDGRHMRDCMEIEIQETATGVEAKLFIDPDNVPYAVHQEFGANGKPFMRPAMDEGRDFAHAIMQAAIDNESDDDIRTKVRFRRFA